MTLLFAGVTRTITVLRPLRGGKTNARVVATVLLTQLQSQGKYGHLRSAAGVLRMTFRCAWFRCTAPQYCPTGTVSDNGLDFTYDDGTDPSADSGKCPEGNWCSANTEVKTL